MNTFCEMNENEMMTVDGGIGVVVAAVLIGGGCLFGGFAAGYGLSRWLG